VSGLVKICGVMRPEHAEAAASAGADLIGFNFAESRRRVTPETARVAIERARAINPAVRSVGLFVDASPEEITRVAAESGVNLVQLHGMPAAETVEKLDTPALIVVRAEPDRSSENLTEYITAMTSLELVEMILLDAYHPTLAGGTGMLADWKFAAKLARRTPMMLAGGLNPGNVADAISTVRPAAVDVSSGVETDGVKDPDLIQEFIAIARSAFAASGYSMSSGTSSHEAP
jgi:phosphoribosylanthranilate isomerase